MTEIDYMVDPNTEELDTRDLERIFTDSRKLRETGGSTGVTFPQFIFENVPLALNDQALLAVYPDENAIIVTKAPQSCPEAELCGSRKLRNLGDAIAVTLPPECLDEIDYEKGQMVDIELDPVTRNIYVVF